MHKVLISHEDVPDQHLCVGLLNMLLPGQISFMVATPNIELTTKLFETMDGMGYPRHQIQVIDQDDVESVEKFVMSADDSGVIVYIFGESTIFHATPSQFKRWTKKIYVMFHGGAGRKTNTKKMIVLSSNWTNCVGTTKIILDSMPFAHYVLMEPRLCIPHIESAFNGGSTFSRKNIPLLYEMITDRLHESKSMAHFIGEHLLGSNMDTELDPVNLCMVSESVHLLNSRLQPLEWGTILNSIKRLGVELPISTRNLCYVATISTVNTTRILHHLVQFTMLRVN